MESLPTTSAIHALSREETLSADTQAVLAREIKPDERIRWMATPRLGTLPWRRVGGPFILLPMAGIGIGAGLGAASIPLFGIALGLPLTLLGLAVMAAHHAEMRARAKTAYIVTDKRALIVRHTTIGKRWSIQSYEPDQLRELRRTEGADGGGDVWFAQRAVGVTDGFLNVRDAAGAEQAIRALTGSTRAP